LASRNASDPLFFLDQLHGLTTTDELTFARYQHFNFIPADLAEINLPYFVRHLAHLLYLGRRFPLITAKTYFYIENLSKSAFICGQKVFLFTWPVQESLL